MLLLTYKGIILPPRLKLQRQQITLIVNHKETVILFLAS